jgi:hypothetical protein
VRLQKQQEPAMTGPRGNGPAGQERRKAMSLFFYGVIILGIVLGGLVLLVLYSLLVMAQRGDEYLDQMELERLKSLEYAPPRIKSEKSETLHVPATSDLYHGSTT